MSTLIQILHKILQADPLQISCGSNRESFIQKYPAATKGIRKLLAVLFEERFMEGQAARRNSKNGTPGER